MVEGGAPVVHDASGLAETVERARALLDEGDVIAARMLASAAYDQAKAAAGFAQRFGAAERLVGKARQLQGDALLIEARARVRLADDYDAAQEAGAVAGHGGKRSKGKIPDGNLDPATTVEIGLTPKEVHEARKLRDAERRMPGIVARAIAARIAAGLEPSRANLRAAVGTASATQAERGNNLYETPGEAMAALLAQERFRANVWEPACGRGAISGRLDAAGYQAELSDLVDYETATCEGELQRVEDFLATAPRREAADRPDIVTNPPYGEVLNRFVAHALAAHRPRRMALLLNLNFRCGFEDEDRRFAMDIEPPARVLVFTRRLPMMHRDGWDGEIASSRMNTAWFVWELRPQPGGGEAYGGPTLVRRIDWKDFEGAAALAPLGDGAVCSLGTPPSVGCADISPARGESGAVRPALTWQEDHDGGRIVGRSGAIEVGAVFPPHNGQKPEWRTFIPAWAGPSRKAKSIGAAKAALERRWAEFVAEAGL
jgi:hypothetical protein